MLEQEHIDGQEESSTSTDESQEESDSTVESKSVPYERFKEVNEELKRLKQERLESVTRKETTETHKPEAKATYSEDDLFVIKSLDSVEELERVKKIAQFEGISLREATQSLDFKVWKQAREEEKRQEEASLAASRGSGNRGKKKDFSTSGLSDKEHKELWRNKLGR